MGLRGLTRGAWRWVDAHPVRFIAAILGAALSALVGSQESTHWAYASLAAAAGICCLVVLVEGSVGRAAATVAGATATIAGALLTLALGFAMDHPDSAGDPNVSVFLVALAVAGGASLYGQFREHRRAEEAERRLHARLDEIQPALIEELRRLNVAVEEARARGMSRRPKGRWRRR